MATFSKTKKRVVMTVDELCSLMAQGKLFLIEMDDGSVKCVPAHEIGTWTLVNVFRGIQLGVVYVKE